MLPAPAADGLHLRVLLHADDHDEAPLRACAADDFVDGLDLGAGGVSHDGAGLFQRADALRRDAVGADEHLLPRPRLRRVRDHTHAFPAERAHHVLVVDQFAEARAFSVLGEKPLRHLHRAPYAEAEAGAFSHAQLPHPISSTPSFSRISRQRSSSLPAKSISVVSTVTESRAGLRGAAARLESCSSR